MKKYLSTLSIFISLLSAQETLNFNTYRDNCLSGNNESCLELGKYFESGEYNTAKIDNYEAVKYYKLSCKKGNGAGCYKIAQCCKIGKSIPKSELLRKKYLKKSCNYNFKKACNELKTI